jgi:hypothetical protein
MQNLATVGYTQLNNVTQIGKEQYFNVFKGITANISFEKPVASFIYNALSDAQQEKLRGFGMNPEPSRTQVWTGSPLLENIADMFSFGCVDGRVSPGTVSADGFLSYSYAIKGMMFYSEVSHVAAVNHSSIIMNPTGESFDITTNKQSELCRLGSQHIFKSDLTHFIGNSADFIRGNTGVVKQIIAGWDNTKAITGCLSGLDGHQLRQGGLFFPYFNHMLTPDRDYTSHVFGSLFLKCLGTDSVVCSRVWRRIRSGLRSIAHTRAGCIFSHAYLGIELSRNAGVPITFIYETGIYHGFTLHGDIEAHHYSTVHKALSQEELVKEVESVNEHDRSLGGILLILNSPLKSDGMPMYLFSMEDIKTSRRLARTLRSVDFDLFISTDYKLKLKDLFTKLSFGDTFAPINQKSVIDFLSFVSSGEERLLDGYGAIITVRLIESKDRISYALGMFGHKAPSLNYGDKGITFTIPREINATDPNLNVPNGGSRSLKFLPFKTVSHAQAVSQWQNLFSKGKFTIPNGRKGKTEFTDSREISLKVGSDPQFSLCYQMIKDISAGMRDGAGKKRRRDDDGEGEVATNKKQRTTAAEDSSYF